VFNRGCCLSIYQECESRLRDIELVVELLRRRRKAMSAGSGLNDALDRMLIFADEIGLEEETAAANALFLYVAGVDQTSAVIGSALFTLLHTPAPSEGDGEAAFR
jgi:cytochrome P450